LKEVEEVREEVNLEEEGMEEENHAYATIAMKMDTWPETVLARDDHGVHTLELMLTQPKISQTQSQSGRTKFVKEDITS
jgi:hypothetical protein